MNLKEKFLKIQESRVLRWVLMSFIGLILVGMFILATPAILGEKPVAIDMTHYDKYKVYKMIDYDENVIFLIDKNGQRTQIQIQKDKISFNSDFDLKKPILYIYNPKYVVMSNLFYDRKKGMEKTDKEFKKIIKYLQKKGKRVYLFKYIDNQ